MPEISLYNQTTGFETVHPYQFEGRDSSHGVGSNRLVRNSHRTTSIVEKSLGWVIGEGLLKLALKAADLFQYTPFPPLLPAVYAQPSDSPEMEQVEILQFPSEETLISCLSGNSRLRFGKKISSEQKMKIIAATAKFFANKEINRGADIGIRQVFQELNQELNLPPRTLVPMARKFVVAVESCAFRTPVTANSTFKSDL